MQNFAEARALSDNPLHQELDLNALRFGFERLRIIEVTGVPPAIPLPHSLGMAEIERLIAAREWDLAPTAAAIVAGFPGGGRGESVAALLFSGRLTIELPQAERVLFSGKMEEEADPVEPAPVTTITTEEAWIEIVLLEEDSTPVAGEKYRIRTPDGEIKEGHLDSNGRAKLEGIPAGTCRVQFPELGD